MSRHSYGMPRIRNELRLGLGEGCSRTTGGPLMAICGAVGIHYRRRGGCTRPVTATPPTIASTGRSIRWGRDRLWVMDVTEHRTGTGTVYLGSCSTPGHGGSWAVDR